MNMIDIFYFLDPVIGINILDRFVLIPIKFILEYAIWKIVG
jgi:hypothetical protein